METSLSVVKEYLGYYFLIGIFVAYFTYISKDATTVSESVRKGIFWALYLGAWLIKSAFQAVKDIYYYLSDSELWSNR